MKRLVILSVLAGLTAMAPLAQAQNSVQTLAAFDKIVVSPLVSVVLRAGEQESIRLEYTNIAPEKVNYAVRAGKLRIYLDGARVAVKHRRQMENGYTRKTPIYEGVRVTAYITYRQLNSLQVRGEEDITCLDELRSDSFRLKVMGEASVSLASLKTDRLKAALYGENTLTIQAGRAREQRYRVYGENKIDAENLISERVATQVYGDSHLNVYASEQLRVLALGESAIQYSGGAQVQKSLVIGEVTIGQTR